MSLAAGVTGRGGGVMEGGKMGRLSNSFCKVAMRMAISACNSIGKLSSSVSSLLLLLIRFFLLLFARSI